MIAQENLEKIKKAVHQPLNWNDYNSTSVIEYTNCFAHAIGSTITEELCAYRLGMISGRKNKEEKYFSEEEVKFLFQADLSVIELSIQEIPFENLETFLQNIQEINLKDNEHIVALFVKVYKKKYIADFHFLRYDKEKGWSEKRWGWKLHFIENILMEWPSSWNHKLVGVFKITR